MSFKSYDWMGHNPNLLIPRLKSLVADLEEVVRLPDYPVREAVDIDDWFLCRRAVPCLAGLSTGHPDIRDGAPTFTSEIYFIDRTRGVARSLSRWYRLDDPMKDFSDVPEHFQ